PLLSQPGKLSGKLQFQTVQFSGGRAPKTELLNEEIFDTLDDARRKLALWRYDYNAVRPHSSLESQAPLDVHRTLEQFEGSAPGALAQNDRPDYQSQTRKLLS
ncbi:integrase core domain-containing protein, partial [uncultured Jannaschia sp.]|uniref:integrase core domain-containing protein n=1 Tax=uncultured Jannaschia sp. TaxID=293347 RepID=UPI002619EFA3